MGPVVKVVGLAMNIIAPLKTRKATVKKLQPLLE